jgi:hypothetical protein
MRSDDREKTDDESALVLASGRRVAVDPAHGEQINVTSPDGMLELAVVFTPAGPLLRLSAAAIELRTGGALRLDCEDLAIDARGSVSIRAGSLTEEIEGGRSITVGGRSTLEAHAIGLRARLGDVALDANDNVRATGEKILLNS